MKITRFKNELGNKYGKLLVIEKLPKKRNSVVWLCLCDCGNKTKVKGGHLRAGTTNSCGCLRIELNRKQIKELGDKNNWDGKSNHELYQIWYDMIRRCTVSEDESYNRYGGRGIKVYISWRLNFWEFVKDMGERPFGYWLERINNNGNYEPLNCKWATPKEQANNREPKEI